MKVIREGLGLEHGAGTTVHDTINTWAISGELAVVLGDLPLALFAG